jgi:O-antigen/teichoic acid export membrane protein
MLFRKAFSLTLMGQSLIFTLGILNTILIVRAIGPQGRGIYYILLTSVSILSILSSGGLIWSNTYWVSKGNGSLKYVFSNGLYQTVFVFFVLLLLTFLSPENTLRVIFKGISVRLIYFSIILVFFELGIQHLNSILLGLQDFSKYNLLSVVKLVLFTLFNFFFLYGLKMNIEGVVYSWMVSAAMTFVAGLVGSMKIYQLHHLMINFPQFLKSLKIGIRALSVNILGQLLLRSDLFLINWYLGLKEVGYYSVSVAVAELFLRVPGIAGMILFPKVATNDSFESISLVTTITRLMGIPLVLGILIFILWGKMILLLAFGKEFIPAYNPMIYILLGVLALSYHIILDNYFAGKGYPAVTVWAPGLSLILNLALNLFLIPKFGISGAAMSTCAAYIFLTAIKLFVFRKENNLAYHDFFILKQADIARLRASLS